MRFNFSCSCPNSVPYEFYSCCKLPETTISPTDLSTDTTLLIGTESTADPCPYDAFEEKSMHCLMWNQLRQLQDNASSGSESGSGTGAEVSCM